MENSDRERYWDGSAWTDAYRPAPSGYQSSAAASSPSYSYSVAGPRPSSGKAAVRVLAVIAFGVHFARYFFAGQASDSISDTLSYWAGFGEGQWRFDFVSGAEKASRIFGNIETWVLLVLLVVALLPSRASGSGPGPGGYSGPYQQP